MVSLKINKGSCDYLYVIEVTHRSPFTPGINIWSVSGYIIWIWHLINGSLHLHLVLKCVVVFSAVPVLWSDPWVEVADLSTNISCPKSRKLLPWIDIIHFVLWEKTASYPYYTLVSLGSQKSLISRLNFNFFLGLLHYYTYLLCNCLLG